jgi:hypothetical protein
VNVLEVASGLRRWTALHPDWTSEEGGPEGWEREVGSISYDTGDELVLIDPLVPAEDEERFWTSLDRDVERAGGAVHVLLTLFWHARSANRMLLPDSWLGNANRDAFFAAMRALLDLPVERVLTAHGEPVLTNGHAGLARALER